MGAGSSTVRNANSGSARGIVAQGPLTIAAGSLVNRGNVSSNGDISLKITGLDNDAGVIGALGKLAVEGSSVTNRGGSLQARQGVDLHIAGGTVAGDSVNGTNLNNTGPLGRQRVVSTGSASYTYVKSHTFSADDRRYDDAPYQSQDIVTNFQRTSRPPAEPVKAINLCHTEI